MAFSASLIGLTALALASRCLAQTMNCVLTVPPNPLTAEGLATPYTMTGCDQTNFATEGCFVEAVILDPATGGLSIYNPLIINQDQNVAGVDFIQPVAPTLPDNAVVGLWFGSNADTLTLEGDTNTCVNGDGNSIFGQFAYCNTPAFFTAAETAVSAGLLTVPAPGTSTKGTPQACPVTRDFRMVDMDQSDNVDSTYLLIGGTKLAQNTPANAAANKNATEISNGSDNALLNFFLQPTLGCTPYTAPSITSPTGSSPAMALNELQSIYHVPAGGPALVPLDDDFTVIDGNSVTQSLAKTNLYRAGVGQSQAADTANASGTTYCQQYAQSGIWIAQNQELFSGAASPAPAASSNLYTFMANRFATSFGPVPALGCQTIFGLAESPVNQTTNGDGIVVAATINTQVLQDILDGTIQSGAANGTTSSTSAAGGATGGATAQSTSAAGSVTGGATVQSTSVAAIVSTSGSGNLSTTAQAVSATRALAALTTTPTTLATSTTAATATAVSTTVIPTTTIVEVVTFFDFILSLGGLPPGVTSNGESFLVLEETFGDLPSAANAACSHQYNTCFGLAGAAFGVDQCSSQRDTCTGSASTASPTASTPGTVTATATVPTTVTTAAAATSPANLEQAATAGGGGGVANAVSLSSDGSCGAPVTVTVTTPAATNTPMMRRHVRERRQTAVLTHW